jgi:hypothetical protein
MNLQLLLAMLTGWLQRHQQQVITYLQAENHILKAQLGGRRLRLTDTERRRLAALPARSAVSACKRWPRSPRPRRSSAGIGG